MIVAVILFIIIQPCFLLLPELFFIYLFCRRLNSTQGEIRVGPSHQVCLFLHSYSMKHVPLSLSLQAK